jgi:hypothetical protein
MGLDRGQIDLGWIALRALSVLGLVHSLRTPQ